jgi:hypothetical protein
MLGQAIMGGFNGKDPRKLTRKEIGNDVHLRFLAETDPEAAAVLHMELFGDLFKKSPMSAPVLHLCNPESTWVIIGDEGWNLLKTVHWATAYADRLQADRYDLLFPANAPGLAIENPRRERVPVLVTACEMRDTPGAFMHAKEIIGTEAQFGRNDIRPTRAEVRELRANPPADLGFLHRMLTGILPYKPIAFDNDGRAADTAA